MFVILGIQKKFEFVFNFLISKNIEYGFCFLGDMPFIKRPMLDKIILVLRNPIVLKNKLQSLLPRKKNNNLTPKFMIIGGEESYYKYKNLKNINIIKAHSFDYDTYLEEEYDNKNPQIKNCYAVFLDSFIPYHPDYLYMNMPPYCSAENYYPDLNNFFNYLESLMNLQIVIAAHPKADYSKKNNPYDNRKIFFNKTTNLVKHSKMVLTHVSTSTHFAVLYKKPIIFLNSSKYSSRYFNAINSYSHIFDKEPIEVDNYNEKKELDLKINQERYTAYKNKYIKISGTPEKKIWEIFISNIEKSVKNICD